MLEIRCFFLINLNRVFPIILFSCSKKGKLCFFEGRSSCSSFLPELMFCSKGSWLHPRPAAARSVLVGWIRTLWIERSKSLHLGLPSKRTQELSLVLISPPCAGLVCFVGGGGEEQRSFSVMSTLRFWRCHLGAAGPGRTLCLIFIPPAALALL